MPREIVAEWSGSLPSPQSLSWAFLGVREYQHRTVGWDVTIGGQRRALAPGEIVETDSQSRALLRVGNIGEVELGPGSRARLFEAARDRQRIFLEHGSLRAHVVGVRQLHRV